MRFVTSFAPSRIERQQACVSSWAKITDDIVAVQSPGETEHFQPLFPSIRFVETDRVGDLYGRPKNVRISAIMEQCVDAPILIINSDIEIIQPKEKFDAAWNHVKDKVLKVGVRWDLDVPTGQSGLMKWGIDIFRITPEMPALLTDIGMTIGCPGWDYWLPYVLWHEGYKIDTVKERVFVHEIHERGWAGSEHSRFYELMKPH